MAKNKTSKFGVADNLKYTEDLITQPDINGHNDNLKFKDISKTNANTENKKKDKKTAKRADSYRFSLYMDPDLGEYVNYIKFTQKKSITDFFNDIVREKMERDISWNKLKK